MDEAKITIPPVADEPVTPLEFLETVYSCNDLPLAVRMRAAIAAAQFKHPKLMASAHLHSDLAFGTRLDLAMQRSRAAQQGLSTSEIMKLYPGKVIEGEVIDGRLIEAPKTEVLKRRA